MAAGLTVPAAAPDPTWSVPFGPILIDDRASVPPSATVTLLVVPVPKEITRSAVGETIVRLEPLPVTVTELPLTALPVEVPPTNTSLATVTAPPPVMAKELPLLAEPTRSLLESAQVVPTPSTVPALPSEPALRPKRALLPVTVAPLVAEKALPEPVLPITRAARLENEPPLTARRLPVAEAASPTITSLAVPVTESVPLVTRNSLPVPATPTVSGPAFVHRPPADTVAMLRSAPAS